MTWLVRLRLGAGAWATAASRAAPDAEIWHGHDLPGLAAAAAAARRRGGRLVYDAHELYTEAGSSALRPDWAKRLVRRREARLAASVDALVTVNDGLADALRARLSPRRLVVVHNCPGYDPPPAGSHAEGPLRRAANLDPGALVALYHGTFVPGRGTDVLAHAILEPGLEDVHAVYLGWGPLAPRLTAMAAEARWAGRLHVLPPVDPSILGTWIAGADVGVVAISPSTLNHRLSTPNKLFECLAAGVPVAASDFPGIRRVVVDDPDGPLGAVCDPTSVAAVAAAIREILSQAPDARETLRARCLRAAHDRWNWERESAKLVELYRELAATGAAEAA